jgi:hypothetical protein
VAERRLTAPDTAKAPLRIPIPDTESPYSEGPCSRYEELRDHTPIATTHVFKGPAEPNRDPGDYESILVRSVNNASDLALNNRGMTTSPPLSRTCPASRALPL